MSDTNREVPLALSLASGGVNKTDVAMNEASGVSCHRVRPNLFVSSTDQGYFLAASSCKHYRAISIVFAPISNVESVSVSCTSLIR
jgi:hypothetical protein